ncbi:CDP-diacylglycerol--serine O-phosphatidyltransferase [Candidatus Riesia pediculicola USDA]|uniref:CDP-diacylglycerol--serine O-phosphatidyltransferase n=1 Tax=Riesia pediculicola (strain USDA) TaxID=515618 RepID=D4G8J1_RIEPU|nr:CDP-diacylglycerol--serine O-phosphatidyltransferase [Candidatus Riesia pediculicola USDA]
MYSIQRLEHQKFLINLKKLPQIPSKIITLHQAKNFRKIVLEKISNAEECIYIPVLYFEKDDSGKEIIEALIFSKKRKPNLDIKIMVDWNRAKRNRIGNKYEDMTNLDWYRLISIRLSNHKINVFGIPISITEIFGTFHLKGIIIDDSVIYSGASISNIYFHRKRKHRYDRYHVFYNPDLAQTMKNFLDQEILRFPAVQRYDLLLKNIKIKKRHVNRLRKNLKRCHYQFQKTASDEELSVCPIIGMGKNSSLNRVILSLIGSTDKYMTICTPYFNFPIDIIKMIQKLLVVGKKVEIIIGDKTANDFYINPKENSVGWINILPYLYEINLRNFVKILQRFIDNQQLNVRCWKYSNHSFHLKGIWIDSTWQLITGNNFNRRSWYFDLENAILVHDPTKKRSNQMRKEMNCIQMHTVPIVHYEQIESVYHYPRKIQRRIYRIKNTGIDHLVKMIM